MNPALIQLYASRTSQPVHSRPPLEESTTRSLGSVCTACVPGGHAPPRNCSLIRIAVALSLTSFQLVSLLHAEEVTIQVTSFQVPALTIGLETLNLVPEQEAPFYEKLVRLASNGEAEIVLDHQWSAQSGAPEKSSATNEFICPTLYEPRLAGFLLCPIGFETRDLGTTVEAEAHVGDGEFAFADWQGRPSRIMSFMLTASRVRNEGFNLLRVANTQGAGSVSGVQRLPNFLSEKISAKATLFSGQPVLVSATGPTDVLEERSRGTAQQIILTFARASARPSDAPLLVEDETNRPSAPLRLHGLTLRMPRIAAARGLWNHGGGPAEALLGEGLELVKQNRAFLLSHAAVATRSGNRAAVSSGIETSYASKFERSFLPDAYETRNTGTTWSVEPTIQSVTHELDVTASSDETSMPIWRDVPRNQNGDSTGMDLPDFLSFALRTAVRMRLGETRLIGAVTPTSEQVSGGVAEDWIDLAFLWTAPMPRRLGATTPQVLALKRQPIATIAVFSLDEGQARALELVRARAEQKPEDIPQAVEDLWDAAASGEVLLSACASLAQNSGNSSRIWAVREWAALAEAPTEHVPVGASVMPSKATTFIKAFNSGTTWEVQCVEDGADGRIDLEFVHDVAPPVLVAFEEGKARNGEAKEAPLQPTTFALSLKIKTRFKSDVPQLLAIEKSPAPPGHPEHGRWLVAVLKVVSSGK